MVSRTRRAAAGAVPGAARTHPHAGCSPRLRAATAPAPLRRRAGAPAGARAIRCWPARCSGCASPVRSGWPPASTRTARGLNTWGALGFGYAEVGTVTAQPQPGNPPPRMFRLPDDRALLNRMGFNNHGAGALALQLARHAPDVPIGVNIGKTKVDPARAAPSTTTPRAPGCSVRWPPTWWSTSARPTPRDCATCRPSSRCARSWPRCWPRRSTPVLVKIAPDLSDADIDEIADLAVELGLAGIVATNTTVSRDGLRTPGVGRTGRRRHLRAAGGAALRWRCCAGCTAGSATGWC